MRQRLLALLLALPLLAACGAIRPPRPEPPQPPALVPVEVLVRTVTSGPIEGAEAVCNSESWGTTNQDGYLINPEAPANTQIDCTISHPSYYSVSIGYNSATDGNSIAVVLEQVPPPDPPGPGPITLTQLRVEGNKRWFANDAGRFDYREYSAFALLGMLQHGDEAGVRANLQGARAMGFTVARVFLAYRYNGPHAGPDQPDYFNNLTRLIRMADAEGMYLRLTFIAATEPWGGVWYQDRRDIWSGSVRAGGEQFVMDTTRHICGQPGVIGELANEPGQIGMRESFHELVALGRRVKEACPSLILGGGAVDGPNDQDPTFAVEPFDYVDAHIERRTAVQGFEWVKRSGEYTLIDQQDLPTSWKGPFISGEPINFIGGRGDDRDESPSVAFAYGAVSRARHYNTNFHFDGGLYGRLPEGERGLESVRCYHAALDAFPMLTDTKWRGHWGLGAGDYWKDFWPNTDDVRAVEQHINDNRGPWRAFGSGIFSVLFPEPDNWNYNVQAEVPVTQVATCNAGAFQASVYRRQ